MYSWWQSGEVECMPNSVEAGQLISGYPAIENRAWLKSSAIFQRLPEMQKTIRELRQRVAEMEKLLKS